MAANKLINTYSKLLEMATMVSVAAGSDFDRDEVSNAVCELIDLLKDERNSLIDATATFNAQVTNESR